MSKNKKALVFGETKDLIKTCEQTNYNENQTQKQLKIFSLINCYDCKTNAELDGYRFALVPICQCCRTNREVEITGNRFERRQKQR